MSILNLHGYMGTNTNTNYRILTNAGYHVVSPQLYYHDDNPYSILAKLEDIVIDSKDIELITATSFGSFFGKTLSRIFGKPFICTNPCLRPDISLAGVDSSYLKNESNLEFISNNVYLNRVKGFDSDTIIIGDNDVVIDHRITYQEALGATIKTVKGGHQLDEEVLRDLLLAEVKRYV